LRRTSSHKEHEIELLKSKNQKLEEKINAILSQESQKIGQTLNRNQTLEKENLELYTLRTTLEENVRDLTSKINHYKNLYEAQEKHQILSKKNISRLEEENLKLTNEVTEIKKRHIAEINSKSEEVTILGFRVEEYTNTINTLREELELKENRIRELGSNDALEEARNEIRRLEGVQQQVQERLASTTSELERYKELNRSEQDRTARRNGEYEQIIAVLRKNVDDLNNSLRESQLENKKIQFELENERNIRASIENYKIPMFHQERLEELNGKYMEYQKKYHKAMEENKRVNSEMLRLKNETTYRLAEITKSQQDDTKGDFALLLSKLQLAISRNKQMNDEITGYKTQLESKNKEVVTLQEEIEKCFSQIRTYRIDNNKLKIKLNNYDPGLNLELLTKEQVDNEKDEEIRSLRDKVRTLNRDLQEKDRNTVDSQKLNELKSNFEVQAEELRIKTDVIESLNNQLRILREASAINNMVSAPIIAERIQEKVGNIELEQDPDLQRQINELVQKRFEFENTKKRLDEENAILTRENREISRKFADLNLRVGSLENQNAEMRNRVNILEKEKQIKNDTITNRERNLSEVTLEQNRLRDEREQLVNRINELEEEREKLVERVRYYEEYTERMGKINFDIIEEKELYLKTILNQKNEIALVERRHKTELEKVMREREEIRQQFVTANNERVATLQKYHDDTFANRLKLENQNIIITNYMKKIEQSENIIKELDEKLNEYIKASQNNYEKDIPQLSEISNILNKSRLTVEDYKNFDAIKELLTQQRTQYEESVKYLETTIDTLGQRYLALEEKYTNDKKAYAEQLDKLRRENLDTIAKYENKIKELEERERQLEKTRKTTAAAAGTKKTDMEVEVQEEGEQTGDQVEEEVGGEDEGDLHAEIENLRSELNYEKENKLKLESEIENIKERNRKIEEEKATLTRKVADLEKEKAHLCRMFTLRETSWAEQKKQYMIQIEENREYDRERTAQLTDLLGKLEHANNRLQRLEGEKEGDEPAEDTRHQDLLLQLESLRSDNLALKRTLEEKNKGRIEEEGDMETEEEELETLRVENNKLKVELDECKVKIRILEDEGSVPAAEFSEEDVNALNETEVLELKKAFDSGSLLNILEKAQSLILAMSQKGGIVE